MVNSGDFKGMTGEIIRIITKTDQVVVRGVNVHTRHMKPSRTNPQGGITTKELPLHMSKVNPVVDGKAVRVGFRTEKNGDKVRVARHSGKDLKVLGTIRATSDGAPVAAEAAAKPKAKTTKAKTK